MSQYFIKPFEPFGGDINIKVDLSSYEYFACWYFKFCIKIKFRLDKATIR